MGIYNIAIWKYNPIHTKSYLNKYQHVEGYTTVCVTLSCVFSLGFVINICGILFLHADSSLPSKVRV